MRQLYDLLIELDVDATCMTLSLSHSRASCHDNMPEYLRFYAGTEAGILPPQGGAP